jgi:hypothetical protein
LALADDSSDCNKLAFFKSILTKHFTFNFALENLIDFFNQRPKLQIGRDETYTTHEVGDVHNPQGGGRTQPT